MRLESLIFPYGLLFAAFIGSAIYIRKFIIIPTLKKYGLDYEEYWSPKKQKNQLEEYIELCKKHGITDVYWRYMKIFNKIGVAAVIGWVLLIFFAERQ
ncbi:MAG: hypothetical protein GY928_10130 [Colwellia sp.]|nr:hypothetical protein [Colwellia sp.]